MVERWRQLPLDHALSRMPEVRAVVQQLADSTAEAEGRACVPVPDRGPAVVMDQLAVMVHDALAAQHSAPWSSVAAARGADMTAGDAAQTVLNELVELRRAL